MLDTLMAFLFSAGGTALLIWGVSGPANLISRWERESAKDQALFQEGRYRCASRSGDSW